MLIIAAPVMVVLLAGITVLLLLFRCHRSALVVGLMAVGMNVWLEQIPIRPLRPVPAVKPEGVLRVFEYNICGKAQFYPVHATPEFIDYVLGQDADLLFLPENSGGVAVELEKQLKEDYRYSLHSFPEFEKLRNASADFTLYSRFPLRDYRNYQVDAKQLLIEKPYLDSTTVMSMGTHFMAYEVTADIQGHPVTLLHLHMRSNGYDHAREGVPGRRKKALNVYERLLIGYAYRAAEAQVIANSLSDCPHPLIICGDFNDFSGSRVLETIQRCRRNNTHEAHRDRLRDAWWSRGQGFGFTFADQHLRLRIDHLLYSKEFVVEAVSVPKVKYSDHRPLVTDLRFEPE